MLNKEICQECLKSANREWLTVDESFWNNDKVVCCPNKFRTAKISNPPPKHCLKYSEQMNHLKETHEIVHCAVMRKEVCKQCPENFIDHECKKRMDYKEGQELVLPDCPMYLDHALYEKENAQ